jgi:hypothetical protein
MKNLPDMASVELSLHARRKFWAVLNFRRELVKRLRLALAGIAFLGVNVIILNFLTQTAAICTEV